METKNVIDVDAMLIVAGDFGKYQYILMILFSLINVLSAFHYFGQTFTSILPQDCDTQAVQVQDASTSYTFNNSEEMDPTPVRICLHSNGSDDGMYGYKSIVQDLNWESSDMWIPTLGQSMFFVGSVIGSLVLGILADRIGRLHVLVLANLLAFCGNLLTIFSSGVLLYTCSRFIAGLATDSNFVMMYIIVMEYIRPSMRTLGLNLCIGVFYCIACVAVPWVAILMSTWKRFLLVVAFPHLVVLGFYFLVPESAQWLLSKGRIEDAIKCFKKIAVLNNRIVSQNDIDGLKHYAAEHIKPETSASLMGLFKTPKLRKKTCILIFKSMVITLCYDAISRNVNGLNYSPFVLFSITSITILPACIFILFLQDYIGRKAMASCSLLLSGIFTLTIGFIFVSFKNTDPVLTMTLMIFARFGINVAYNSSAQYAVELIPTEVRGQGVSVIHVAGYAASFFSPQLLYLGIYWRPLPEIILGILLMVGSATCLLLPETLNKSLPVTLQDGELFGEDEKIWDFPCFSNQRTEN